MRATSGFSFWGLWFFLSLLSSPIAHGAAAPPPAEAFGTLPHMRGTVLSPNGNMFAWIQDEADGPRILMYDLSAQKTVRTLALGKYSKARDLMWVDDETLLLEASFTQEVRDNTQRSYEIYRYVAADVHGGPTRILMQSDPSFSHVTGTNLISVHPTKAKTVFSKCGRIQPEPSGRNSVHV